MKSASRHKTRGKRCERRYLKCRFHWWSMLAFEGGLLRAWSHDIDGSAGNSAIRLRGLAPKVNEPRSKSNHLNEKLSRGYLLGISNLFEGGGGPRQIQYGRRLFDRGESSFGLGYWPAIVAVFLWCFMLYFFGVFSAAPGSSAICNSAASLV